MERVDGEISIQFYSSQPKYNFLIFVKKFWLNHGLNQKIKKIQF